MDYNNEVNILRKIKNLITPTRYVLAADIITITVIVIVLIAGKAPSSVSGITVSDSDYKSAVLTWDEAKYADGYRVYRSVDGKKYDFIDSTGKNSYTDSALRTGKEYYYKVISRKAFKSSSIDQTPAVRVLPQLKAPKLKIDTSKGIIELSYTDVEGAISYEIMRNGKTIGSTEGTTYVDESAKGDEPYKYEVKAVRYKKEPVYSKSSNKVAAELHSIQDFMVETAGDELSFKWTISDHYDNYKLYDGETMLAETHDDMFRLKEYDLDKVLDIKLVGYNSDTNVQSPEIEKRFKIIEEPMDNEGARAAACEWGVEIANDDSFSYGTGSRSHRYGCYFCGTNVGPNKNLKGSSTVSGHSYAKTYCCNPFAHACYAHGAGDENMLAACRNGKGIGHSVGSFTRYGNWKSVGRPSTSNLEMGDVLVGSGHVMLYIGDGQVVHAKSEGWGAGTICTDSVSRFYGLVEFVMRYTGTGSGTMRVIRDVDENGSVIENTDNENENENNAEKQDVA